MSLDDPRLEWMRDKVCVGLNIKDYEVTKVFLHFVFIDFFNKMFI